MKIKLLAGAAAFFLVSGAAFAGTAPTTTTGSTISFTGQFTDTFTRTSSTNYSNLLGNLFVSAQSANFSDLALTIYTSTGSAIFTAVTSPTGVSKATFADKSSALNLLANTNYTVVVSGTSLVANSTLGLTGTYFQKASTGVVAAVPEPESYAMLLAGLGLVGTIARRRNKASKAV